MTETGNGWRDSLYLFPLGFSSISQLRTFFWEKVVNNMVIWLTTEKDFFIEKPTSDK